jgi:hypothetical protein
VGAECVVGEGTRVGERASIKKSVIGKHCVIHDGVKIINSVIMNHVTISAGYAPLPLTPRLFFSLTTAMWLLVQMRYQRLCGLQQRVHEGEVQHQGQPNWRVLQRAREEYAKLAPTFFFLVFFFLFRCWSLLLGLLALPLVSHNTYHSRHQERILVPRNGRHGHLARTLAFGRHILWGLIIKTMNDNILCYL